MSTTTQILFNSPALRSLKRDQLVKLCKIHALKANGKNTEIIQRLREHARTLPKDAPLSVVLRNEEVAGFVDEADQGGDEEEGDAVLDFHGSRPSEQWEVVMDSIQECEENSSQGTMSSQRSLESGPAGEFGTTSTKATTVSSSIKALANSLGLKRTVDQDALRPPSSRPTPFPVSSENDDLPNSKPYALLPESNDLPQTDHFTLQVGRASLGADGSPLPGHVLRPGVPAPENARLSMGTGLGAPITPSRQPQPTTTIRLVMNPLAPHDVDMAGAGDNGTPVLKPFQTNFDLEFGSPLASNAFSYNGFGSLRSWPATNKDDDIAMSDIYPKLTFDDLPPSVVTSPAQLPTSVLPDAPMPGEFLPANANPKAPFSPQPFLFGSPRHSVSNHQFRSAAASVLEEMNARLRADGVDQINLDIVDKLHPNRKAAASERRDVKPIPNTKRVDMKSKFDKMHEQEFGKMEGIDETMRKRQERQQQLAAKKAEKQTEKVVGKKRKSTVLEPDAAPRRPPVLVSKSRGSTTRVFSRSKRSTTIPGGFAIDDEDNGEASQLRAGKRAKIEDEGAAAIEEQRKKDEEDERKVKKEKEKERLEKKKKAQAILSPRRSSQAGRTSIGGARRSVVGPGGRKSVGRSAPRTSSSDKEKQKKSRFGFFSSAKSIVTSMWNRGKSSKPSASKPLVPGPASKPSSASECGATVTGPASKPKEVKETDIGRDQSRKAAMGPPAILPRKKPSVVPARSRAGSVASSRASSTLGNAKAGPSNTSILPVRSTRSRSPLPSFGTMSSLVSGTEAGPSGMTSRTSSLAGTGRPRSLVPAANGISSIGTRLSAASRTSGTSSLGVKKTITGTSSLRPSTASPTGSTKSSIRTSSRLLAPTASSLAKTAKRPSTTSSSGSSASSSVASTPVVSKIKEKEPGKTGEHATLGTITNAPAIRSPLAGSSTLDEALSPKTGGIFSKPLILPGQSSIPIPVKRSCTPPASLTLVGEDGVRSPFGEPLAVEPPKPRSLNGRKPRISRSKVIARLASQREATTPRRGTAAVGTPASKQRVVSGKSRSSLGGAKVTRASYGSPIKSRTSTAAITMSAKKRARQSEYMRRKSVKSSAIGGTGENCAEEAMMEVDTES